MSSYTRLSVNTGDDEDEYVQHARAYASAVPRNFSSGFQTGEPTLISRYYGMVLCGVMLLLGFLVTLLVIFVGHKSPAAVVGFFLSLVPGILALLLVWWLWRRTSATLNHVCLFAFFGAMSVLPVLIVELLLMLALGALAKLLIPEALLRFLFGISTEGSAALPLLRWFGASVSGAPTASAVLKLIGDSHGSGVRLAARVAELAVGAGGPNDCKCVNSCADEVCITHWDLLPWVILYAVGLAGIAAVVEELAKYALAALTYFWVAPAHSETVPHGVVVLTVAAVAGFASLENIEYTLASADTWLNALLVPVFRLLTPLHYVTGVLLACRMAHNRFDLGRRYNVFQVLWLPILLHFAYDCYLILISLVFAFFVPLSSGLVSFLSLLTVVVFIVPLLGFGVWLSIRRVRALASRESPFEQELH